MCECVIMFNWQEQIQTANTVYSELPFLWKYNDWSTEVRPGNNGVSCASTWTRIQYLGVIIYNVNLPCCWVTVSYVLLHIVTRFVPQCKIWIPTSFVVFAWLVSQPLSYKISTSHQLPTSQQYCSLIANQHQPSATAKRTQRLMLLFLLF